MLLRHALRTQPLRALSPTPRTRSGAATVPRARTPHRTCPRARTRTRGRSLATLLAAVLGISVLLSATGPAHAAPFPGGPASHPAALPEVTLAPGPGFPAHYAAPYVEVWNSPSAMESVRAATGLKYFTLAFIIDGGRCDAAFNGDTPVSSSGWTSAISSLRAAGGDVIAAFGGSGGTEIARSCSSVSALKAEYKRVVDTLGLTRLDFDIEGTTLNNTTANDRRNAALAELQQEYAAAGRKLDIDYTLPVSPTGLLANSLSLLNNAKSHGLDITLVNIMTMDYGPSMDMGNAAIGAANAVHTQLGQLWPAKSSAQLWAMEGNTPMAGVNDSTNEVFTTSDAVDLTAFAKENGIQELSFWSLGRDRTCARNGTLSDTCSGTPQAAYQFSTTFNTVTDSVGAPPAPE